MKRGVIIQARMGSSRFPGKVMANLGGKPALWHVVKRCAQSRLSNLTLVATSLDPEDDEIEAFCRNEQFEFIRGSQDDVLSRYYEGARRYKLDVVARVTGDEPLMDAGTIDDCFHEFERQQCDYVSTVCPGEKTYPRGLDVEVFGFNALERVYQSATERASREHVTYDIWKNVNGVFKIGTILKAPSDLQRNYRLTLDYKEDYDLLTILFNKLTPINPLFSAVEAIQFLDAHPDIAAMNLACEERYLNHCEANRERFLKRNN